MRNGSNLHSTNDSQFFRPPQRSVPFHNGLLDTRTKHTIAQDRLVVAEQRILEAERRKSASHLQLLTFEQKQAEKRLAVLTGHLNSSLGKRPFKMRGRSTSEVILRQIHRSNSWNETLLTRQSKLSVSLHNSNHNLLSLPKIDPYERRYSTFSDGDAPETTIFTSDFESGDDEGENELELKSTLLSRSTSYFNTRSTKQDGTKKRNKRTLGDLQSKPLLPIVSVIPPDDDVVSLVQ